MILKDWSQLAGAIGKLEGMATAIEWTEDIDPKKIKEGMLEVVKDLEEVFEAEREKIEDVNYKKDGPRKSAETKKGGKK
jgi:hypothetical protein